MDEARAGRPPRLMGFFSACALGVGTMIGAGIFSLSADAARYAGPGAVLSYLLAGASAFILAFNFGHLAASRPVSGGPYVYIRDSLGIGAASVAGWQLWLGMALSASFYALGFARYLTYFWPGIPEWLTAPGCVLAVAGANALGHRAAAFLQNLSVALLLFVLGGFVAVGVPRVDPAFWSPFFPYGWDGVLAAVPLVFTSYLGFEMVAQAAGAIANAPRTVPAAMLTSVGVVTLLYTGIIAVSVGIVHHVDLAGSATPLAEVARRVLGRAGASAVAAAGLIATLSSANGVMLASLELGETMAADGLLPRALAPAPAPATARHGRFRSSSLRLGAAALVIATLGTLVGQLEWLARGVGVLHFLPFSLIPFAVMGRKTGARERRGQGPLLLHWGSGVPLLGLAVMGFMLRQINPVDFWVAVGLTVPGVIWFALRPREPRA
ncbi:MAG: APC family permease [Bacillota bacterium]